MGKKPPKRKPGERLPEGKAKEEILRCVLTAQSPPSTPEIKQYLRKSVNIRSPKTVVGHLDKLKGSGLLIQNIEKKGLEATWSVPQGFSTYREIWDNFKGLQDVMMKVPRVQERLMKTWGDTHQFNEGTPGAEDFKYGLRIHTFFQWHIENDPLRWILVKDSDGKKDIKRGIIVKAPDGKERIETDHSKFTPLSEEGLTEWSRLSGEEMSLINPHGALWELIRKAAFYDYLGGGLTEERGEVLQRIFSEKERRKIAGETIDEVLRRSSMLQLLEQALEDEKEPFFADGLEKDLKSVIEESKRELAPLLSRRREPRDLTYEEAVKMKETLQQITNKFFFQHHLLRYFFVPAPICYRTPGPRP